MNHSNHGSCGAMHLAKDPVCGMSVDPERTTHHHDHGGRTYHFCCGGCRTKFAADPERYLGDRPPAPAAAADAIYTCPRSTNTVMTAAASK